MILDHKVHLISFSTISKMFRLNKKPRFPLPFEARGFEKYSLRPVLALPNTDSTLCGCAHWTRLQIVKSSNNELKALKDILQHFKFVHC